MSVGEFQRRLHGGKYPQNDVNYFPLGIRRDSQSVTEENGRLPVSVELVKAFSRSLLETGTPAWQRLQAVRSVEAYRDLALGTGEPSNLPVVPDPPRSASVHSHRQADAISCTRSASTLSRRSAFASTSRQIRCRVAAASARSAGRICTLPSASVHV